MKPLHALRRRATRRAGLTLVELMVASVIVGTVASGVVHLSRSGGDLYQNGMSLSDLELKGARAMERMVREIGEAQVTSLNPPNPAGGSLVEFVTPEEVNAGVVTWGSTVRYARELDPQENLNGVDDDGDGLVDEGVLVRIEDPGGLNRRRVLVRNVAAFLEDEVRGGGDENGNGVVDEEGFCVTVQNGPSHTAVTLQLTVETQGNGGLLQRSMQATITLKN